MLLHVTVPWSPGNALDCHCSVTNSRVICDSVTEKIHSYFVCLQKTNQERLLPMQGVSSIIVPSLYVNLYLQFYLFLSWLAYVDTPLSQSSASCLKYASSCCSTWYTFDPPTLFPCLVCTPVVYIKYIKFVEYLRQLHVFLELESCFREIITPDSNLCVEFQLSVFKWYR